MRALIGLFLFTLLLDPLAAEVYKRIGPGGEVEFSDTPGEDAEPVVVPPPNTYRQEPLPSVARPSRSENDEKSDPLEITVRIVSPTDDEPVVATDGKVTIQAAVEPALRRTPGKHLRFLLDGTPVGVQSGTTLRLDNVNRGTHQIAVQVLDAREEVLAESPSSTFHMIRPSVHLPGRQ